MVIFPVDIVDDSYSYTILFFSQLEIIKFKYDKFSKTDWLLFVEFVKGK